MKTLTPLKGICSNTEVLLQQPHGQPKKWVTITDIRVGSSILTWDIDNFTQQWDTVHGKEDYQYTGSLHTLTPNVALPDESKLQPAAVAASGQQFAFDNNGAVEKDWPAMSLRREGLQLLTPGVNCMLPSRPPVIGRDERAPSIACIHEHHAVKDYPLTKIEVPTKYFIVRLNGWVSLVRDAS